MKFSGSMVALVTPMLEDGSVDTDALDILLNFHLENHTDGLVVLGTTGEAATITADEHQAILRFVLDKVSGQIPVISGVGSNSTQQTILNAQADCRLGVDALLIATPYYNKPTQSGLYQHYKNVEQVVDKPIILYNVPGRTAVDLYPDTVAQLAELDNIIGIKETLSVERVRQLRDVVPAEFEIYCGDDENNLPMLQAGANGLISVTANVAPKALSQMVAYLASGELDQASKIHQQLMPLHKNLFIESNPIPVKYVLNKMGLIKSGIRLPLTWLSMKYHADVDNAMQAAGIGENVNATN